MIVATVASDRKLDDAQLEPVVITTMRRRHLRNVLRIEEKTSTTPWSLGLFLAEVRREEREYLVAQISRFGGNISRTAEFIGMERSALHRKLKSLAID